MLSSCASVLRKDLMEEGIYDFNLSEVKQNPVSYEGRLFILGGIIVRTTVTKEGSLIEAIYAPVNSQGYLRGITATDGRFLAIFKGKELLDPLIFSEKREITLAGRFIELRKGTIDEREYSYPFFEIEQVHLWKETRESNYYDYRYYPYYYPPPPYFRYRQHYYPWWWYY